MATRSGRSDDNGASRGDSLSLEAQQQATDQLLGSDGARANVVGFAYGEKYTNNEATGNPALVVLVNRKVPEELLAQSDVVPSRIGDLNTDVFAVGDLVAQSSGLQVRPVESRGQSNGAELLELDRMLEPAGPVPQAPAVVRNLVQRVRPCPAAFSIGNVAVTAGTLAGVVYDFLPGASVNPPASGLGKPARYYVLSNNHILAASNLAPIGSAIVQPGPIDGGIDPRDRIATLSRFVPIQFSPQIPLAQHNNVVDCAIGECSPQDATREIYMNGAPRAWARRASIIAGPAGTRLRKTGRTTGLTLGRVVGINATVDVNFGGGRVARFKDQILTTNMSDGGDSGSLVTDWDNNAVGLLFAGSAVVTILNHIENVRAALRVEIAERVVNASV